MDINILRSIATVLFFVAFLWVTLWAYSKKQKDTFNDAAHLPFADEPQGRTLNSVENGDELS